jgi:hypothetical protein
MIKEAENQSKKIEALTHNFKKIWAYFKLLKYGSIEAKISTSAFANCIEPSSIGP